MLDIGSVHPKSKQKLFFKCRAAQFIISVSDLLLLNAILNFSNAIHKQP